MTFDEAFTTLIDPIQGWSQEEELAKLHDLSSKCIGVSIEIGAFCGRATAALSLGRDLNQLPDKHYVVDHFVCSNPDAPADVKQTFTRNMARLPLERTNIQLLPVTSGRAWPMLKHLQPGLVFIDGNHTYNAVSEDASLYAPLVAVGGWLIFHDFHGPFESEIRPAVERYLTQHPEEFEECELVRSMKLYRRIRRSRALAA